MAVTLKDLKGSHFDPNQRGAYRYETAPSFNRPQSARRFQRILLISPPATLFKGDLPRCTYPLGLGYIAAVLESSGYDVRILDCLVEGYEQRTPSQGTADFITYGLTPIEVEAVLRTFQPDVVGISSIFSNQADAIADIITAARRACPQAKLATGGAHARYFPENYISDLGVDAVFTGEAELSFLEYMEALNGEGSLASVSNVVHRNECQNSTPSPLTLIRTDSRDSNGRAAELDCIPFPAWHLYNMERYFDIGAYQSPYTVGRRVAQIYTSRGCTAKCTFCTTTNFWGGKLRRRSPANVIAELEALKTRYKIDEFHVQDDNITNDKKHAKELFRSFKSVQLPWCTPQGTALWRMDREILDLMADSGCYQITFALESGVQRVLNELICKPLDLLKTRHLIGYAQSLGIAVHGFFIIGMPPMYGHEGESFAEMNATFDFAQSSGLDSASFFTATPIVGSALLAECVRQRFIADETPLYKMSYKQGLINVPGLWTGTEVATLAAKFNTSFNSGRSRPNVRRNWTDQQY